MGAMTGELAFEQDEAVDLEGIGVEVGIAAKEGFHCLRIAAVPSGEGDVRCEGAALGLDALTPRPNDPEFGRLWGLHNANDVDIDAPDVLGPLNQETVDVRDRVAVDELAEVRG